MQSNVAELPVADRVWAWFETNKKPVLGGSLLVLVIGVIIGFFVWQKDQKELAASRALSDVAAGQLEGAGARGAAAEAYLKVAANYPNSGAAARASLLAAGSLFVDNKFAEAQAQFEKFVRTYPGSPFTEEALIGVATSLEAQGKTDQAINAYKDLVTRHPNSSVTPQAELALGRLYESQNKLELARDQFEKAEHAALPYSSLANDAGMRLEELIAKNPQLAPPPPPMPTNPPVSLEKK